MRVLLDPPQVSIQNISFKRNIAAVYIPLNLLSKYLFMILSDLIQFWSASISILELPGDWLLGLGGFGHI